MEGPSAQWWVYKICIEGLEQEERLLILGPDGAAGLQAALQGNSDIQDSHANWHHPAELSDTLDKLQTLLEESQEARWSARQQQLINRREDIRRLLDREEKRLGESLIVAQRKLRSARTAGQSSSSQGAVTRAERLLDELRTQRPARVEEAHREVDVRLQELGRLRYVEVRPVPIFSLVRGST